MAAPLVTCCMIVRDEAANLPACCEAASALVDEWIVLDTGSTDATVAIAEGLGARLLHVPWRDDFSFVRNASLEPATGTWTIWLDADDRLEGAAELRSFLESEPPEDAFLVLVQSPFQVEGSTSPGWESLWQPRVFRTSAGVRFQYPVHNIPMLDGLGIGTAPGRVRHIGYLTAAARKEKAERTLRLLSKLPDGHPHRLYHHVRALGALRRLDEVPAIAERLATTIPVLPPDVRVLWSQALLAKGDPQQAVAVLAAGLRDHPEHPDIFYGLLAAGGVGFAGASLNIHRAGGAFSHVAVTLGRAPRIVEGLVHMGILNPEVLESDVMKLGVPEREVSPHERRGARFSDSAQDGRTA